jgi:hypothetical protein
MASGFVVFFYLIRDKKKYEFKVDEELLHKDTITIQADTPLQKMW